jgi:hypothetical protein
VELPAQRNPELREELHAVVCGNEKLTATVAELTGIVPAAPDTQINPTAGGFEQITIVNYF